jgi:glycosyltransferase involved in cell wall biosynthesis
MSLHTLTVGLPVYNGEPFLTEALDSILGQTFGDFQLVVSDNGSTDATEAICREYASRDRRVDYHRHDVNRGAAWNYNNVFAHCQTPFFRWAAADDVFAPTCFERCGEVMAEAPQSVVLCYPKTLVIDADGAVTGSYDDDLDLRSPMPHQRIRQIVRHMVQGNAAFGLVRSDALRATRGHLSFPGADWVLVLELALQGEIWELPERLFLRRRHAGISRMANPSPEDYTLWFDPSAKPVKHERLRLLHEYFAAVRHADLAPFERAACYATVTTQWARRYGSIRRPLRRLEVAARRLWVRE